MRTSILAAAVLAIFAAPARAQTTAWEIDSTHASAQFSVRHFMVSNVRGDFSGVKGTVLWNEKDAAHSGVNATVDVATVFTRDAQRDAHLKSADFFDVGKYPTMSFQSKSVTRAADGKLKVAGDLTLHGVTKEVVFDVDGPRTPLKDLWGNTRSGLQATAQINRKDFGLKWNRALETGGVAVGEEVAITIDLELVKKSAK